MVRLVPLRLLLATFATLTQVAFVGAQSAPAGPFAVPPEKKAPAPQAPAAPRPRGVSPEVASQLSAAIPKFTPPPPKPAPKAEEELPDLREIDKPKNNIIRLPKVIVQESRPPVFSERAIMTEKGIKDIAMRRFISDSDRALNRFGLPFAEAFAFGSSTSATEARALAMYAEEERLKNMADMKDAAGLVGAGDGAKGGYILRDTQKTFMRTPTFGGAQGGGERGEVLDLINRERR